MLTSLRFPDSYIFDRLTITHLTEDSRQELCTLKYGQFAMEGDWLGLGLDLQVQPSAPEVCMHRLS